MNWQVRRVVVAGRIAVGVVLIVFSRHAIAESPNSGTPVAASRVLILTGGSGHHWRGTSAILRRILEASGRFDVRICESYAGLTARTLADFDVVVDHHAGPPLDGDTERAIAEFVKSGKGLVVTHGAIAASSIPDGLANAVTRHGPAEATRRGEARVQFLRVKIAKPEHPIVQGIGPGFRTADALVRGLKPLPASEVIATAAGDAPDGGTAKEEPVVVVSTAGKGRVCMFALGHDPSAMHEPEFASLFARATEWAATGKVTLPAEPGLHRRNIDAVRGLVITGGHDHDAAFYSLFDGYKDLGSLPVLTSAAAFKGDIRNKYDVLIMYDFTRELDDAGKKNLRDFVENGGGVVVLHHALLNFQKWTWWSEEVVGGRYRLQREGDARSSSVKDDQQIWVTPAGDHPITAGIGPFHITDEAYKFLYMSPRIRPLLTTDNPTSDTNLAWLGPQERFRVVAIQLGHGRTAFGHPSYRALVHNAILWAAGKLK